MNESWRPILCAPLETEPSCSTTEGVPGSRANIDHLVVAASGIWIIDAKSYNGKVEQRDVRKWLQTDNRLYVNGRDQSKLVSGLARQINAVLEAIDDADIRVSAAAGASSIQNGVCSRVRFTRVAFW